MEPSSYVISDDRLRAGRQREPVAIVGIGCRLPGHASSPAKLWDLLCQGRSGHCKVPRSRFNADAFYHPNPDRPGSINSVGGYFIQEDIHAFENTFFGINNLEARDMDAQQRKLLEVVYESFEDAGQPLEKLQGSNTGVFVGNFTNDSMIMQYKDPEYFSRYSATGVGPTVLSNRITHCFDLRGPSVVLDTACSSSLYALHSACLALDAYDCDAAVVASANLIQSPEQQLIAVKAGILSPDSKSHTFDESANGYGRAEGVSALFLKRVCDAVRDNDTIRGVIRGTAVNGNGKTPGIVQPSIKGQEAVMRAAYRRAGLETNETDYIELHGTGTKVGDPIEVESVSRVFQHKSGRPTLIGGIKPSLGHSEGSSGISSLIKLVLAIETGTIPATIGIKSVNPSIKLNDWNIRIADTVQPWPSTSLRRASVNSFGFGGANGHAIVEAYPKVRLRRITGPRANGFRTPKAANSDELQILTFSAATPNALKERIDDILKYACQKADLETLRDLAYTLNCRRSRLPIRAFLLASPFSLRASSDAFRPITQGDSIQQRLPLTFVYTGQGAQWAGMGSELIKRFPTFQDTIRYFDQCLQTLEEDLRPLWTLESVFLEGHDVSDIHLPEKSQLICTALQIAITNLFRQWHIQPTNVLGHSSGEIAAAYASGYITSRQAIMAAYLRGLAVSRIRERGAMLAAGLSPGQLQEVLDELKLEHQACVACVNSPENSTLSGDSASIAQLFDLLQQRGTFVKMLKTNGIAYHSHHMRTIGPVYQKQLEMNWSNSGTPSKNSIHDIIGSSYAPTARMISSVTQDFIAASDVSAAHYWRTNLESSVQFAGSITKVLNQEQTHIIEIGPHSALELPINQTAINLNKYSDWYSYSSALVRGKDAVVTMLDLVGSLFLRGCDDLCLQSVSESEAVSAAPRLLLDLPTYPWDCSSAGLWREPRVVTEFRERKYPRHDLLGSQVPGGNRATITWRNVLDVDEIPWLKDHCLGPSIVFPAAAYIAMAVEAVSQANGLQLHRCPGMELQNFAFLKAMDFDAIQRPRREIFTEMRRHQISCTAPSAQWWHFNVSSISDDHYQYTSHVNGLIKLGRGGQHPMKRCIDLREESMEQQAARVWYSKFKEEGLNWGPRFAIMEEISCDKARRASKAYALTHLLRDDSGRQNEYPKYIVHPISLDGMLQTAFVATTAGMVRDLRATVPVSIESIHISCPEALEMSLAKPWRIVAQSERVGFGTVNIDAELMNSSDDVLVRMGRVRAIRYQGNRQMDKSDERNPLARVIWKPDVTMLANGPNDGFSHYLDWYVKTVLQEKGAPDESILRLAGALDLIAFKCPNTRILVVNFGSESVLFLKEVLRANSISRRFKSLVTARLHENGELYGTEIDLAKNQLDEDADKMKRLSGEYHFDVILTLSTNTPPIQPSIVDRLTSLGFIVSNARVDEMLKPDLGHDFVTEAIGCPFHTTIVRAAKHQSDMLMQTYHIVLVSRGKESSPMNAKIQTALEVCFGMEVTAIDLEKVNEASIPFRAFVVSTVEIPSPLLPTISHEEMEALKTLTNRAAKILWMTNANFIFGTNPEFALVLGLARALMLEQPSVQFSVFDINSSLDNLETTVQNLCFAFQQLVTNSTPELEFAQKDGILHCVRWEPDDPLNFRYRLKQNEEAAKTALREASRCELSIRDPGQLDTIYFRKKGYDEVIPTDHVEIQVKSDMYALSARVDTKDASCSCECAGIVSAVGADVTDFAIGDRVVAMAPGHFATYERFPQWAVCKLQDHEDFDTVCTIPIVFSTAIYGLRYRANLQAGESVLIHSAAGGVGIAAIQFAKHIGADIFATVGKDSKKKYLVEIFGLNPAHIFDSRSTSLRDDVLTATNGRGVDVVLNSLTGELLHESFKTCADFGRFVEIGKKDIIEHGHLDMISFSRNVSFMAFDLSDLFLSERKAHHELWQSLVAESMALTRTGIVSPCSPLEVFDVAHITEAFRHFSSGTRIGKVAVSFQDDSSKLSVLPSRHDTVLDPGKTYLMIGCLGGLGRSIAKWMYDRGARQFIFLSRSGQDKSAARTLIDDLNIAGAVAEVARGDVGVYEDVERAVQAAKTSIGGVIQGAMALSEALWTTMSVENWHTTIRPKVQGTWNLHNALRKNERDAHLDFFVMISSISGTVGTATESNYCAANAFLDAFARYRNNMDLPAISIGYGMIAEVGYLHEHPEIELLLKRKGIHSINEDEMLQILDLALAHQNPCKWQSHYDLLASSHLLTGIEFVGLQEQRDRGFEGDNHVLSDPRASLFAAAFERSSAAARGGPDHTVSAHGLPEELTIALKGGGGEATSVIEAVRTVVAKKIANLILLPLDKLRPEQKLGDFGLDSMLAAEFRTYIFRALEVDVPFMMLLDKSITVNSLAIFISTGLTERDRVDDQTFLKGPRAIGM